MYDYGVLNMRKICLFYLLWLVSVTAGAVEVRELYHVEVPVADQSDVARTDVIKQAMAQMLTRITGRTKVADDPAAAAILEQAGSYIQQYRYINVEGATPQSGTTDTAGHQGLLQLQVSFDEHALNKALRQAGLPVWGRTRPAVLALFAVETPRGRVLLDAASVTHWGATLHDVAAQRGIPLIFPVMDPEDQGRINLTDVWGNFTDLLLEAGKRYHPDALLVGKLYALDAGQWRSQWYLTHAGKTDEWVFEAADESQALDVGLNAVADRLAERYALVFNDAVRGSVRLRVQGIRDLPAYVRVLNYLQTLEVVERAQVVLMEPDQVVWQLQIHGEADGLQRLIALGDVLKKGAATTGKIDPGAGLVYQLQP
ncbi:MAG: hypothetical protein A2V90_05610 [Gammaproteobacteria bacterium RBG_16_57_12]|nr:MAG: hypothetical protein A2V90_05610 [Gammaproteobacteria bacterium RBG_16_57_12]